MQVAKEWGMRPSEFYACDEEDKAYMIATIVAEGKMEAWNMQVQEKEARKAQQRGSSG